MGLFDYVYFKGKEYQSKDTPHQICDKYKIEEEQETGQLYLWHEAYKAKWVKDKESLLGYRLQTSGHHWEHCDDFDGLIRFYRQDEEHDAWIEFKALFMDGKVIKLEKIKNV